MTTSISRSISISAVTIFAVIFGVVIPNSIVFSNPITTEVASSQLGKPVRVELGSTAIFSSEQLEIKVLSVGDSRCSKDVRCYWGGEAQVKLNVQQAGKNLGDIDLTLGVINPEYFYPNNIKQVGKYYIRVLDIDPYPATRDPKKVDSKVIQAVTLQVQKTPFKLKDTNLEPRLQARPLDATRLGNRFNLLNDQSYYLTNAKDYVQAKIYFEYARPSSDRSDLVEIAVTIQPTGSPERLNTIKKIVKLGTPLQIQNREGGFNLRVLKVSSFTEDTRSNLNYPSPVGYRAVLKVEKLEK